MKYLVIGGGGFVGSHLVDELMKDKKNKVAVYDGFSSGKPEFLAHIKSKRLTVVKGLIHDRAKLAGAMKGCDFVYHLAANPDIRRGIEETGLDLERNAQTTLIVLQTMQQLGINKIAFSSSGTIYGDIGTRAADESKITSLPISLYGASKLYCEALISAYCDMFGFQAWIFRFANVIGPRATHGVAMEFVKRLRKDPTHLEVLGNGKQRKGYIYVKDCVSAMTYIVRKSSGKLNVYNIAASGVVCVDQIAKTVIDRMGLKKVKITHTGGRQGWKGDIPFSHLSSKKLSKLGFTPVNTSKNAVDRAICDIINEVQ